MRPVYPAYGIKPHFIDVVSILLLGKLYTPLSACFVCLVFPSRNNPFLFLSLNMAMIERVGRATYLKQVIVGLLGKL